jgi:hypothetical protein
MMHETERILYLNMMHATNPVATEITTLCPLLIEVVAAGGLASYDLSGTGKSLR